jgi:pimeloyl-ACP methyl ester carboxylesterase
MIDKLMSMGGLERVTLSTGIELDVQITGDPRKPPIILLHGFPESHRTWRGIVPDLARDHYVIAPDQRGYARSSKPVGVENYRAGKIVADLFALADHLEIKRFVLVGHDWGGAIAWAAALGRPDRVSRLVIINAPHPLVFQRTLFDDPAQREASQYIRDFRDTSFDSRFSDIGLNEFFNTDFLNLVTTKIASREKQEYLEEWSQPGAMTSMLNWYRASRITVPAMEESPSRPGFLDAPFPLTAMPVLVVWGIRDKALLPCQLAMHAYVPDLSIEQVDGGHFVPWENPREVLDAMRRWRI